MICRLLIIGLLPFYSIRSQNLIRNSSFEEPSRGIGVWLNKKICKYWRSASKGTPDYFSNDRSLYEKVPENRWGNQMPKSGKAHVGIVINYFDFEFEYLRTELIKPLEAGKKYCFSINVSLSDKSELALNQLNYLFTKERAYYKKQTFIKEDGCNVLSNGEFLSEKTAWVELKATYTAKGGEKYLFLGVFNETYSSQDLSKKGKKKAFTGSYYYIDDVSLLEVKDSLSCHCHGCPDSVKKLN